MPLDAAAEAEALPDEEDAELEPHPARRDKLITPVNSVAKILFVAVFIINFPSFFDLIYFQYPFRVENQMELRVIGSGGLFSMNFSTA